MSKSKEHELTYYMRKTVISMMRRDGRDFTKCQLCPATIPEGQSDLHHTKYEGAGYADILIVCKKCNHAPENVGLY